MTCCIAQGYLKALLKGCNAAEGGGMDPQADRGVARLGTARVAVRCLALLLASLPHFNYAGDILQVPARAPGPPCGLCSPLLLISRPVRNELLVHQCSSRACRACQHCREPAEALVACIYSMAA